MELFSENVQFTIYNIISNTLCYIMYILEGAA